MTLLLQQIVLGLLIGGVYVAVAVGFSLVWGILNIVNLAHGALVIAGAYLTWWLFATLHVDPFLSLPAVAAARDAARLVGIDLRHVYALTFAIGAACAGVAGGLISTTQAISPSAGDPYTLQAFVVVVLGGLGRVGATVVGGLLFGLIETLGQTMVPGLGAGWANAIAFAILVVVLVVRPQGLLGRLA